jgi:hypothetical protein
MWAEPLLPEVQTCVKLLILLTVSPRIVRPPGEQNNSAILGRAAHAMMRDAGVHAAAPRGTGRNPSADRRSAPRPNRPRGPIEARRSLLSLGTA